jgi:hypothetical protein
MQYFNGKPSATTYRHFHMAVNFHPVKRPNSNFNLEMTCTHICQHIKNNPRDSLYTGVSRLVDIIAGGDFLGLCNQKSLYKYVSNFGRLRSYGHFSIPVHALV